MTPKTGTWLGICVAALVVAATCGAVGCGARTEAIDFTGRQVSPPFVVADGSLESTAGGSVGLGADQGAKRLRLVFFGYTHCPDECPTVLSSLAAGLAKLDHQDQDQVQSYFVTTDPDRDTPALLRAYVARFDSEMVGLYGPLGRTAEIAHSIGIYVDHSGAADDRYDPDSHSTYLVAIGRDGKAPVFWNAETSPSEFARDIRFLLHGDV